MWWIFNRSSGLKGLKNKIARAPKESLKASVGDTVNIRALVTTDTTVLTDVSDICSL